MKEHPILFSTLMVQALLAGRKTQTRRAIMPQPYNPFGDDLTFGIGEFHTIVIDKNGDKQPGPLAFGAMSEDGEQCIKCKYGKPGDILWVRETWGRFAGITDNDPIIYRADGCWEAKGTEGPVHVAGNRWKPSIHMAKADARIWLQIESVRVERAHDISEEDAQAEGTPENYLTKGTADGSYWAYGFNCLWNAINGKDSWDANPWVWVVSFKVLSTTGRP